MKKKNYFILVVFLLAVLLASLTSTVMAEEKLKVVFVYAANVADVGWYTVHDRARKITDEELDFVETSFLENVTPGATAERVMTELCKDGYDIIVAPSADFEADALKVAEKYPDVKFLICAGNVKKDPNVESYYPKTSQVWYILGQVAGKLTKTNILGVVGAVVVPINLQIQNAWQLGARSVNPDVKQRVIYINTYYDPAAERDAALALIDAGADVIMQATNSPAHVQAAEEKGVYAMSQFEDMRQFGPNAYVSGDLFHWEKYYIPTFKAIYENTWEPRIFSPDLSTEVCDLSDFGPMVTEEMKEMVEKTKDKMISGEPEFFWKGPIYDVNGNLKVKEGEQLNEEELISMDWWVDGIITSMTSK